MANPGAGSGAGGRKGRRAASGFKPILDCLESHWKHEARFRLLLLSVLLALIFVFSTYLILPHMLPRTQRDDLDHDTDWTSWLAGITPFVLMAWIWGQVRRSGLRIAELQNTAHQIQYLAVRHAKGIAVAEEEWQVFEEVVRLLNAASGLQSDEPLHPLLALLAKIFRLNKRR